ncbi:MAG TPA: hypothetical protein VNK48_14615 [Xanthobacteraceae bacterium]|nr:hypothetical protein [Xanthobacteraceae bacterium]
MAKKRGAEGDQLETETAARAQGLTDAEIWLKKIERARKEEEDWRKDAEEAVKVYEADEENPPAFNVLHSNTETLLPALYNSTPIPDVRRRFGEGDIVAKHVVDLTERCLSYSVDQYDFDDAMETMARHAAVVGRGVVRIRYIPQMRPVRDERSGAPMLDEAGQIRETIGYQEVICEAVPWEKFIRGPGRSWSEVKWIAFEHDLTREELVALNPQAGEVLGLGSAGVDEEEAKTERARGVFKTACVYEIWDKKSRQVIFIAKEHKEAPLRIEPDPLGLTDFFPTPRPIQALKRVNSLCPITPYRVWKPLFWALDKVTKRIDKLANQLRVRGLVDAKLKSDLNRLATCDDGQYEAADDVAMFAQGPGGLEKAIAHWPLEPTVKALGQLEIIRAQIKAFIDEVTGVADLQRGQVDPREKLGQSQLKAQWGSLRLQKMQNEIARVARDLFRMKTEVLAAKFTPANLSLMSGLPANQEQQQLWPQVLEVFRSDARSYRIDIETNSTIRADMTRNQEQMNMFLAGSAQFVQGMTTAAAAAPMLIPTMIEVYAAFARMWKLGKQAEDALDKLTQAGPQIAQMAMGQQQRNGQQTEMEMKAQERQQELAMKRDLHAMDIEAKRLDLAIKQQEQQAAVQKLQLEQQGRELELAHRTRLAEQELATRRESAAIQLANAAGKKGLKAKQGKNGAAYVDPTTEAISALLAQLGQMAQQAQAQNATMMELIAAFGKGLAGLQQTITAPREIVVTRDSSGKVVGGRSLVNNGALAQHGG